MISPRHLEGIAREILERTGVVPPVDAFELARACGFVCRPWGRGGGAIDLAKREIRFNGTAREQHQHGIVAHELGHFAITRGGEDARDEPACRYMAGAFLLPMTPFRADSLRTSFDLEAVRALHPNASAQMICVRFAQVSPVSTAVWDAGHPKAAYGPPIDEDLSRELVSQVLASGVAVRGDVSAYPVFSPRTVAEPEYRRVILVDRRAA